MTEKKLTRAEHIKAMRDVWIDAAETGMNSDAALADYAIAHGMEVAPEPLPEPPEPERVRVVDADDCTWRRYFSASPWSWTGLVAEPSDYRSWQSIAPSCVLAEPSYWRDHPEYAEQYEAWKAAQS